MYRSFFINVYFVKGVYFGKKMYGICPAKILSFWMMCQIKWNAKRNAKRLLHAKEYRIAI